VELLKEFEPEIEKLTLVPSTGGRFELTVNDKLLYSKLSTGHHLETGDGVKLIKKYLQEDNR